MCADTAYSGLGGAGAGPGRALGTAIEVFSSSEEDSTRRIAGRVLLLEVAVGLLGIGEKLPGALRVGGGGGGCTGVPVLFDMLAGDAAAAVLCCA